MFEFVTKSLHKLLRKLCHIFSQESLLKLCHTCGRKLSRDLRVPSSPCTFRAVYHSLSSSARSRWGSRSRRGHTHTASNYNTSFVNIFFANFLIPFFIIVRFKNCLTHVCLNLLFVNFTILLLFFYCIIRLISLFLYVHICLCVWVCLIVCCCLLLSVSVCLSVCLFLSDCLLFLFLSDCPLLSVSVYLFVCCCTSVSVCISILISLAWTLNKRI